MLRVALTAVLIVWAGSVPVASGQTGGAAFVAVVPDPAAPNDRGEHLVIEFSGRTDLAGWAIADDDAVARFEPGTAVGRVVVTEDPAALGNRTSRPVVALRDRLGLANAGERLRLLYRGRVVDVVEYGRAREGFRYVRRDGTWRWEPIGATHRPSLEFGTANVTAFVLPDSPSVPIEVLRSALSRVLLGGYTLTDERVAPTLCSARDRGVRVDVLVEADPVGGLTRRSAGELDRLAGYGVAVALMGGPRARYAFHHAKYAVVDDRALVMTENWKPAGTGGRSSRGWGVVIDHPGLAEALASVFEADSSGPDAVAWSRFRPGADLPETGTPEAVRFHERFEPRRVRADGLSLLLAPDNAEASVVGVLDGAEASIDVVQVSVGGPGHPFVRALVRAARRGVRVRLLISRAWYVRDRNEATAAALRELADREELDLEVRLARPRGRFEKVHAKAAVIDDEAVLVGSLNWNNHSVRRNREVALVLEGPGPVAYFAGVFRADWAGGRWDLPVGYALAVVAVGLGCGRALRGGLEFDGEAESGERVDQASGSTLRR